MVYGLGQARLRMERFVEMWPGWSVLWRRFGDMVWVDRAVEHGQIKEAGERGLDSWVGSPL